MNLINPKRTTYGYKNVAVIEKREREVRLVIPTRYNVLTKNKEMVTVLNDELPKEKEKYKNKNILK